MFRVWMLFHLYTGLGLREINGHNVSVNVSKEDRRGGWNTQAEPPVSRGDGHCQSGMNNKPRRV